MNDLVTDLVRFFAFVGGCVVFAASIRAFYRVADGILGATLLRGRPRLAERAAAWLALLWALACTSAFAVLAIVLINGA